MSGRAACTGDGIDAFNLRVGAGEAAGADSTISSSTSAGIWRCVSSAGGSFDVGLPPRRARADIIPSRSGSMSCAIGSVVTVIGRWVVRKSSNERPNVAGRPKLGRMGGSSMKSPRISGMDNDSLSDSDVDSPSESGLAASSS
jgi:hypothetical protein